MQQHILLRPVALLSPHVDLQTGVTASGTNQEVFSHLPELPLALSLSDLYACLPACWLAYFLDDSIAKQGII